MASSQAILNKRDFTLYNVVLQEIKHCKPLATQEEVGVLLLSYTQLPPSLPGIDGPYSDAITKIIRYACFFLNIHRYDETSALLALLPIRTIPLDLLKTIVPPTTSLLTWRYDSIALKKILMKVKKLIIKDPSFFTVIDEMMKPPYSLLPFFKMLESLPLGKKFEAIKLYLDYFVASLYLSPEAQLSILNSQLKALQAAISTKTLRTANNHVPDATTFREEKGSLTGVDYMAMYKDGRYSIRPLSLKAALQNLCKPTATMSDAYYILCATGHLEASKLLIALQPDKIKAWTQSEVIPIHDYIDLGQSVLPTQTIREKSIALLELIREEALNQSALEIYMPQGGVEDPVQLWVNTFIGAPIEEKPESYVDPALLPPILVPRVMEKLIEMGAKIKSRNILSIASSIVDVHCFSSLVHGINVAWGKEWALKIKAVEESIEGQSVDMAELQKANLEYKRSNSAYKTTLDGRIKFLYEKALAGINNLDSLFDVIVNLVLYVDTEKFISEMIFDLIRVYIVTIFNQDLIYTETLINSLTKAAQTKTSEAITFFQSSEEIKLFLQKPFSKDSTKKINEIGVFFLRLDLPEVAKKIFHFLSPDETVFQKARSARDALWRPKNTFPNIARDDFIEFGINLPALLRVKKKYYQPVTEAFKEIRREPLNLTKVFLAIKEIPSVTRQHASAAAFLEAYCKLLYKKVTATFSPTLVGLTSRLEEKSSADIIAKESKEIAAPTIEVIETSPEEKQGEAIHFAGDSVALYGNEEKQIKNITFALFDSKAIIDSAIQDIHDIPIGQNRDLELLLLQSCFLAGVGKITQALLLLEMITDATRASLLITKLEELKQAKPALLAQVKQSALHYKLEDHKLGFFRSKWSASIGRLNVLLSEYPSIKKQIISLFKNPLKSDAMIQSLFSIFKSGKGKKIVNPAIIALVLREYILMFQSQPLKRPSAPVIFPKCGAKKKPKNPARDMARASKVPVISVAPSEASSVVTSVTIEAANAAFVPVVEIQPNLLEIAPVLAENKKAEPSELIDEVILAETIPVPSVNEMLTVQVIPTSSVSDAITVEEIPASSVNDAVIVTPILSLIPQTIPLPNFESKDEKQSGIISSISCTSVTLPIFKKSTEIAELENEAFDILREIKNTDIPNIITYKAFQNVINKFQTIITLVTSELEILPKSQLEQDAAYAYCFDEIAIWKGEAILRMLKHHLLAEMNQDQLNARATLIHSAMRYIRLQNHPVMLDLKIEQLKTNIQRLSSLYDFGSAFLTPTIIQKLEEFFKQIRELGAIPYIYGSMHEYWLMQISGNNPQFIPNDLDIKIDCKYLPVVIQQKIHMLAQQLFSADTSISFSTYFATLAGKIENFSCNILVEKEGYKKTEDIIIISDCQSEVAERLKFKLEDYPELVANLTQHQFSIRPLKVRVAEEKEADRPPTCVLMRIVKKTYSTFQSNLYLDLETVGKVYHVDWVMQYFNNILPQHRYAELAKLFEWAGMQLLSENAENFRKCLPFDGVGGLLPFLKAFVKMNATLSSVDEDKVTSMLLSQILASPNPGKFFECVPGTNYPIMHMLEVAKRDCSSAKVHAATSMFRTPRRSKRECAAVSKRHGMT
jgi:hypothetical protein